MTRLRDYRGHEVSVGAEVGPGQKAPDVLDRVILIRSPWDPDRRRSGSQGERNFECDINILRPTKGEVQLQRQIDILLMTGN